MHKGIRNYRPLPTERGVVCPPSIRRSTDPDQQQQGRRGRSSSPSVSSVNSGATRQMLHHLYAPGANNYATTSSARRPKSASPTRSASRNNNNNVSPTRGGGTAASRGSSPLQQQQSVRCSGSASPAARHQQRPQHLRHTSPPSSPSISRSQRNNTTSSNNGGNPPKMWISPTGFDYEAEVARLLAVPERRPLPPPRGAPSFVIVASAALAKDGTGGVPVMLSSTFDRARAAASQFWQVPKFGGEAQPQQHEHITLDATKATPEKTTASTPRNGGSSIKKRRF